LLPKKGRFSILKWLFKFLKWRFTILKCRFTKKTHIKHPQKTRDFGRKKTFGRKKLKNKGQKWPFFVNIFYFLPFFLTVYLFKNVHKTSIFSKKPLKKSAARKIFEMTEEKFF